MPNSKLTKVAVRVGHTEIANSILSGYIIHLKQSGNPFSKALGCDEVEP